MRLVDVNPWWKLETVWNVPDKVVKVVEDIVENDRELRSYIYSEIKIDTPFPSILLRRKVDIGGLRVPVIYLPIVITVRGPRQTGKTTRLKLLVLRLLGISISYRRTFRDRPYSIKYSPAEALAKPRQVLYVDCDKLAIESPKELVDLVHDYIRSYYERRKEKVYVIIDEISNVREWTRALKALAEIAVSYKSTLIASGSCSFDIKRVSETIAGRRGEESKFRMVLRTGPDIEYLPVMFRDYVKTCDKTIKQILASPSYNLLHAKTRLELLIGLIQGDERSIATLEALQREIGELLRKLLTNYFITGGLPVSIEEFYVNGIIPRYIYERVFELIMKDCIRYELSQEVVRNFLKCLIQELSSPVGLEKLSKNIGISRPTLQRLVEFLEQSYILFYLYAYDVERNKVLVTGYSRKYYFTDPFFIHTFRFLFTTMEPFDSVRALLNSPEEVGKMLENIIASHLRYFIRNYLGTSLLHHKENLFFGLVRGREVDFLVKLPLQKTVNIEKKEKLLESARKELVLILEVAKRGREKEGFLKAIAYAKCKGIYVTLEEAIKVHRDYIEVPAWLFLLLL